MRYFAPATSEASGSNCSGKPSRHDSATDTMRFCKKKIVVPSAIAATQTDTRTMAGLRNTISLLPLMPRLHYVRI